MLFTNVKRKAEEGLSRERIEYRERYQETLSSAEMLLDTRYEAVQLLHGCEEYLQMISNHPYTYDLKRSKVYKEYQAFEKQLDKSRYHAEVKKLNVQMEWYCSMRVLMNSHLRCKQILHLF